MRTVTDSDSATSESDVENSYNTDNEVETDSASESDSDNVDDTSSEVHIKLSVYKKSYRVTDKYTPNGALYKFMQNMQFFRPCAL